MLQGGTWLNNAEYLKYIDHTWQKNTDEDMSAYANIEYLPRILHHVFSLKPVDFTEVNSGIITRTIILLKPILDSLHQDPPFTGIETAQVYPYQPVGNPEYNTSNYTATENITAGYIQARTQFGKFQVLGGVRVEATEQSNRNLTVDYPGFQQHFYYYTDWLPSLHLSYNFY